MLTFDWATVLTVVSTVVTALATAFLAGFTFVTVRYLRRQEDRAAQDRLEQQRPLLIPASPLAFVDDAGLVEWTFRDTGVLVHNVDPGVALNVVALLLGPRALSTRDRYRGQYPTPVPSKASDQLIKIFGASSMIPSQTTIGGYPLCAPNKPSDPDLFAGATWQVLRLTLTYRDIFSHKHAAIFDYAGIGHEWETVAIIENIPKDLLDLEEEAQRGPAGP